MKKFVKLTQVDECPVLIDLDSILMVREDKNRTNITVVSHSNSWTITVLENIHDIEACMSIAKEY